MHLLVVIDHRHAQIYRTELHGAVPQRVTPYDPTGEGRHLLDVQDDSNGQRKPEHLEFYESIARALHGAEKILIFGSGTGASSAMDQLLDELERRHGELANRVVGSIVVDQQHQSEDQLLAQARKFYAALATHEKQPVSSDEH